MSLKFERGQKNGDKIQIQIQHPRKQTKIDGFFPRHLKGIIFW